MATLTLTPEEAKTQWVDKRRSFLGGSDAFQLLSEKQYSKGCVRQLAYEKLGAEPDFEDAEPEQEALFRRGNLLEPLIAAAYAEETGRKIIRPPVDENGLPKARMSKEYPFAGVHVDRTILAGTGGVTETGDCEIKSRAEGPFYRMLRSGPFPGDFLQTQWSNWVTGHSWSAFVAMGVFGSIPIRHYDLARDEKIIDIFKREGSKFADTVWGKGELPEHPFPADDDRCKVCSYRQTCRGEARDSNAVAFLAEQKKSKFELVQIDNPELAQALRDRQLIKGEIKTLDNEPEKESDENPIGALQIVERRIYELQRDQDGNRIDRAFVLNFGKSYLTPTTWSGVDVSALKAQYPDIYSKVYCKGRIIEGSETLRTYPAKG